MGHADARSVPDLATTVRNSCFMIPTFLRKPNIGSSLNRVLASAWVTTTTRSWECVTTLPGEFSSVLNMGTRLVRMKIRGDSEFAAAGLRRLGYLATGQIGRAHV